MIWPQLLLWVISFVLTDYFRERLPSQTASGIGDFNIPTATEGRPVPICIGGTVRFEAPNCIWYGDFAAVERTTETGVIFKKDEVIGFEYLLALQYALFKGPSAGITGVWIGDDRVFDHVVDAGGIPQTVVDVDRDDLFGGKDGGGGFIGRIRLFDGSETQAVSGFLATRLDPLPAYRGLSYIMVTDIAEVGGANIGESNQLRFIRVELQTFDDLAGTAGHAGLGDSLALLNDTHFIGPDLNPAVAAWDVWTNTRWGRGFGLSDVDIASFQAAAATCFAEGIGWTNVQDEQTTTGAIQDLLEQHMDAYIGPNPLTGLIEVTLARPDYTIPALPLVSDVGAAANLLEVKQWDQGDWSNTKNRIRIRYTAREKDWKETHAVETAAGNRIIQGRTATEEIRFPGCHTQAVGSIIAAREKRGLSLPLQKGTIVVNRTAYELRPGQVFRLTSAQTQTTDLPVRVTKMSIGDTRRQSLELSVVEDIFGNEPATVEPNPPSDFVPPIQVVAPFLAADQAAFEAPFIMMRADVSPNSVPRVATLARRVPGNAAIEYEVLRRVGTPPAGAYTSTDFVRQSFTTVGELRNAEAGPQAGQGLFSMQIDPIGSESLDGLIDIYAPAIGNFAGVAVISPGLANEEFVLFDEIVDDLAGIRLENVYRACMDTFWKSHNAGERIWFFWTGGLGMGGETYTQGIGVEMKFLPRSPNDAVLEASAVALPVVTIDDNTGPRNNKPLLPAICSFEEGIWPAGDIDFDGTVVPQAGGNYQGNRIVPQHRLWRTQDILWSVQGLDIGGGGFEPSEVVAETMDVSVWIHDLDQDPGAARANAVLEILNQVVINSVEEIKLEKSVLVAGGAIGISFNARLEIEMRHSPTGQVGANLSHLPGFFDFTATGVFSLEPDQVVLGAQFNGKDTDAFGIDEHARDMVFLGDAQIDTASFVFGGASLILDGTGDFVHLASPRGFDWYDGEFTIDFRVRFDDVVSAQVLLGQAWLSGRRTWYLEWDGNSFELRFSRSGSDGPFTNIALGAFTPIIATWYNIRIVQRKDPSSPRFSCYVDGTRIGTTFTAQSHIKSGTDWILGARYDGAGVYTAPFTGQIDELEVRAFAAIDPNDASYTPDVRPGAGPSATADAVVANFEDADLATDNRTDDSNRWELTFGATSEIDTAQFMFGTSSLRCDGVNSLTPASGDGVWMPETLNPTNPLKAWALERKDWTMEAFVRYVTLPNTNGAEGYAIIAKYNRPSGNRIDWAFWIDGNDDMAFMYSPLGIISSQEGATQDIGALSTGVWYHFAAQRVGNNLELLFDGNRVQENVDFFAPGGGADRLHNQTDQPVSIARFYDVSSVARIRALDGWIDGVRTRVGSNLYSGATYTIPTLPPDPGDQGDRAIRYLFHFEVSDFFTTDREIEGDDNTRGTRINFNGSAQIRDDNSKFGTFSGLTGGGSGDSFSFDPSIFWWDLADEDFTIDVWFRVATTTFNADGIAFVNQWLEAGDERAWRLSWNETAEELEFVWTTDGTAVDERRAFVTGITQAADFPLNTYVHVAVERDSTGIHLYLDGVLQTLDGASDAIGADVIYNSPDQAIVVGNQNVTGFNGYIFSYWDELRITKSAEYGGATFTPEVAAYTDPPFPNV